MERRIVSTTKAPAAIGPYSQAVVVEPFLFASGQIPLTPDGHVVSDDIREQTEQVLANVKAVLEAEGLNLSNVAKATVFLADMNDFPVVNEIYAQHFGDHKPARSTVQVARLPRDARVEIEVIACR